ncbi:MAG: phosphotransferase [Planctomycetes bacterium]|nr:phosphotransferase [Planctomycetota bacterium]
MTERHAWDDRWEFVKNLPGGGQGHTILVLEKNDGSHAVVKYLKNQESRQARRRIAQEVTNLKVLHDAGAKVPRVLDGNTENFDDPCAEMYFVMEYIDGEGLAKIVNDSGGRPA